jgi:DNA modification methylase
LGAGHNNWTQTTRLSKKRKEKEEILKLRKDGLTQSAIAQKTGYSQGMVSNIINDANGSKTNKSATDLSDPFSLNYWRSKSIKEKVLEKVKYFGKTPEDFIENLLYYHTKPSEVVVDFFAGTGTTWDVSDKMERICHCYDRIPIGGKEHIIKKWNVMDGLPSDLPDVIDLVYLDPPYWIQAEGEYSKSPDDLGNMTLDQYNQTMQELFNNLKRIGVRKLAFYINPTIYKDDEFIFVDHTFDFHKMIKNNSGKNEYDIIARYSLAAPVGRINYIRMYFC